jgi:hypothetical protein
MAVAPVHQSSVRLQHAQVTPAGIEVCIVGTWRLQA